jgi:hypothetical protein
MQKVICYLKWLYKKIICNEHGTWVAVAVAGVGVAAAAGTAVVSADSSRKAANTQADAAKNATSIDWEMYNQNRKDYAPWREAGKNALSLLESKVNAGPGEFTESPGYEFRLKEGQKTLERSAAARTGVLGGDTERALVRYGQDYATNEYDNFLSRYYQSLTPYQSLSDVGQTATAGTVNAGTNAANQIASNAIQAGNAQATGYINNANAISGGVQSAGNNMLAAYSLWKQK